MGLGFRGDKSGNSLVYTSWRRVVENRALFLPYHAMGNLLNKQLARYSSVIKSRKNEDICSNKMSRIVKIISKDLRTQIASLVLSLPGKSIFCSGFLVFLK